MIPSTIVKGSRGFTFEFKRKSADTVAFIRYQPGERDVATVHYLYPSLFPDGKRYVTDTMRGFTGATKRVIQAAVKVGWSIPS